jgi:hypothetical protein
VKDMQKYFFLCFMFVAGEVATKPNNVDGASSDCFIPHIPPHIPPSRHNVDVAPSTPKTLNAEYESPKSTTISPCLHLE